MNKSSKNLVGQRIAGIVTHLLEGRDRRFIVQFSSDAWQIGERQTDKYIQKAKEQIAQSSKRSLEYDFAKAVRRYESLYSTCIDKKDYRTAMSINKELTILQGLHKNQVEHSGEVKFICSVPD